MHHPAPVKFNSHRLRKGGMAAADWDHAGRNDLSPLNPATPARNINDGTLTSKPQTPVSILTSHSRLTTKVLPEVSPTTENSPTTFFTYRAQLTFQSSTDYRRS